MSSLYKELQDRGFIKQMTNESLFTEFEGWGKSFYCGYDPTADSLHLGHMVTIMAAVNFMRKWNTFVMLIGGATGMIWDPSFKDSERSFLDQNVLNHNQDSLTKQVRLVLENLKRISGRELDFKVVNNFDFYKDMSILDFLRNVGKYITVNTMIAKETIKKRVEDHEKSISYTEFSYTLLQGYDFLKLYKSEWVTLQLAGSDQRWNITTGTELVRKAEQKEVNGITIPLILASNGKKFGKSEGNAIWLDPQKNSPYIVFQYFMNTADEDIERFLKLFTLLDLSNIQEIQETHQEKPEERFGQKQLAKYVTEVIFWEKAAKQSEKISQLLFGKVDRLDVIESMSYDDLDALSNEIWWEKLDFGEEIRLIDVCTKLDISSSNWEAKKLIKSGSIYCNEKKVSDIQQILEQKMLINNAILIRKWKKVFKLIQNIV